MNGLDDTTMRSGEGARMDDRTKAYTLPATGPLDKACSEGLMPGAVAALRDLGVDPPGCELTGIRYLAGARSVAAPFVAGPGRGVWRTVLS